MCCMLSVMPGRVRRVRRGLRLGARSAVAALHAVGLVFGLLIVVRTGQSASRSPGKTSARSTAVGHYTRNGLEVSIR